MQTSNHGMNAAWQRLRLRPAMVYLASSLVVLAGLACLVPPAPALAETETISAIRVEGNLRVDEQTVLAYMRLGVGDPFDPGRIDRSLKALFGTSLFGDVTIIRDGTVLVVQLRENPLVNIIAFEGNSQIGDDELRQQIPLSSGSVFARSRVASAVQLILQQYRRVGRFNTQVEVSLIHLPQNRVNLVFEIEEGTQAVVRDIFFIGNEAYSDTELRQRIQTTISAWWKILAAYDTYDPDRIEFDAQLLRNFYIRRGYADFSVVSSVAELAPDGGGFYLTFVIDEGPLYRFGETRFESEIPELAPEELIGQVEYAEGDYYDALLVSDTLDSINSLAQERGYAFARIDPILERDQESGLISIAWKISQSRRSYIERVNIRGNSYTQDTVIRREILLQEGDIFNRALLSRSRRNLAGLDFFSNLSLDVAQGSLPDYVTLNAAVVEKPTGELSLGIGYSSLDGFISDFSIRQKNFLGRGQSLDLVLQYNANADQTISVGFTEPYFLGRDLRLRTSLFSRLRDYQDVADYDLREVGGSVSVSFPAGDDDSRFSLSYELSSDDVYNVGPGALDSVRRLEGTTLRSIVGYGYSIDRRDEVRNPSDGWYMGLNQSVAGFLGGNVYFINSEADVRYYQRILREAETSYVGAVRLRVAHIVGYNGELVPLSDRFFLGGRQLRGFDASGAGPREEVSQDSVGANYYALLSGELRIRSPTFLAYGLTPVFFVDMAYIGESDERDEPSASNEVIVGEDALRMSTGFSLFWDSPIGPMQFDFSDVLVREPDDEVESFRFTLGIPF